MSYTRPCNKCGERISLRQMPQGQWVAFDVSTEETHICGIKHKPDISVKLKSKTKKKPDKDDSIDLGYDDDVSEINEDSYLLSSHKSKKIAKLLQSNKNSEDRFLYRCWIDPVNFKCKKIAINLLDIENTIIAEYNDWKKIKDNLIPMNSSITYINKLDTISVKLNYNTTIKLNNKLTFPFKVTNSYTPFNIDLND